MQKNNFNKSQRYPIRKLSVGVTSVLLGLAFMSNSSIVKATTPDGKTPVSSESSSITSNPSITPTDNSTLNALEQAAPVVLLNPHVKSQTEMETNGVKYSASISVTDKLTGKKVTINGTTVSNEKTALIEYNKAKDVTGHIKFSNDNNKATGLNVDFNGFVGTNTGVQIDTTKINLNNGFVLTGNNGDTIQSTIRLNPSALKKPADSDYNSMQYYIDHGYTVSEVANNASYIFFQNKTMKANETYTLDIPFKIEMTEKDLRNLNQPIAQINPLFTWINGQSVTNNSVITRISKPIKDFNQHENQKFLPIFRTNPKIESYYIPAEDLAQLTKVMPTIKGLVKINNFGNTESNAQNMGTLWTGGFSFLELNTVQQAIQKLGYSVDITPNNQGTYAYYTYNTNNHAVLSAGSNNITIGSGKFTEYAAHIEVHQVLNTKPLVYKANSQDAKDWPNNITRSLAILPDGNLVNNIDGKTNVNIKGDPTQVFLVDNGGYDPSKPGIYTVTLGYKLQNSNAKTMLITKNATIQILQTDTTDEQINVSMPENILGEIDVTKPNANYYGTVAKQPIEQNIDGVWQPISYQAIKVIEALKANNFSNAQTGYKDKTIPTLPGYTPKIYQVMVTPGSSQYNQQSLDLLKHLNTEIAKDPSTIPAYTIRVPLSPIFYIKYVKETPAQPQQAVKTQTSGQTQQTEMPKDIKQSHQSIELQTPVQPQQTEMPKAIEQSVTNTNIQTNVSNLVVSKKSLHRASIKYDQYKTRVALHHPKMNKANKVLPQTGEKTNYAEIFGAFISSLIGLIGIAGTFKHRNNK